MEKMIIKAEKADGGYRLIDAEGNYPQEGKVHKSRQLAYIDATFLWPWDSTWQGEKVHSGYRITID